MRFFESRIRTISAFAFSVAIMFASACATPLHDDDIGHASSATNAADTNDAGAPALSVATGCLPFHAAPGVTSITGGVHSLVRADGSWLFVVDDATVSGADVPSLAFTAPKGASLDESDCLGSTAFASGAASSALLPNTLGPLSLLTVNGHASLFYSNPFVGVGVAGETSAGIFTATNSLLFTGDRPPYGTASAFANGFVYAYGCVSARFLDADCYVSRVSETELSDEAAYTFYTGGGQWSSRIDDAWPVTPAGNEVDVAFVPALGLWLMAYAKPLGSTIAARIGAAPDGPWSSETLLATCDLKDPDMFCNGVHLHADLPTAPGTIAVSYAIASLSSDVATRKVADPDEWWPRLASVALPPRP